jgi:hypothetical protein
MLATELVTEIKRKGQIQQAETVITDDDLIALANRELEVVIFPKIMSLRENYFLAQKDYAIGTSRRFRLPRRIMGDRISQVIVINGNENYALPQSNSTVLSKETQTGFYMSEGEIIITGTMPTGTLRIVYPCRPPLMVLTPNPSTYKSISAVGANSVTSVESGLTGTLEVIRGNPPHRTVSPRVSFAAGVGTDLDCSTDYTRYDTFDFSITQNASPYVPLEETLMDWLTQRVVMRYYEMFGHQQEMMLAGEKLKDIEKDVMAMLSPRVENEPKTISNMEILGWRY